jgi:TatD DNase family protein
VVVGEIGLDKRSGHLEKQEYILRSILRLVADEPVLLSVHSRGCADHVLDILAEVPHRGTILHWFMGTDAAVVRAVSIGCYFSVNENMSKQMLTKIPLDRMLPETDSPFGARRPGDIEVLEQMIASITDLDRDTLRRRWYRNLRDVATASGAMDKLPDEIFHLILPA